MGEMKGEIGVMLDFLHSGGESEALGASVVHIWHTWVEWPVSARASGI